VVNGAEVERYRDVRTKRCRHSFAAHLGASLMDACGIVRKANRDTNQNIRD
jgi:hypothetical protein